MRTYSYWAKGEIDFLRRNVGIIPFSKIGEEINRSVGSVSSKVCRLKLKSALHGKFENEMNPNWKGGHYKKCKVCGNTFWVCPSTENSEFCSRECCNGWRIKNSYFENEMNPNWKGGYFKECEVCGKEFWVIPSRRNGRFCSRECKGKAHSKEMRGVNHPRYGKTLSEEVRNKISKGLQNAYEKNPDLARHIKELNKRLRGKLHPRFGKKLSGESRKKISEGVIKAYERGAYETRPTDIEKHFMLICRKYNLPYNYTGNGSFWVSNMNPDFIHNNGKNVAIEILGVYWHSEEEFQERKKKFAEHNWKVIGIWGNELRELPETEIVNKAMAFDD